MLKRAPTTRIPPTKHCSNCILRIFSLWWSIFDMSDIGGLCAQLLGGIFSTAQLFGRSVPCPTVIFHLQCGLKRICHRLWGGFEPLCRNWLVWSLCWLAAMGADHKASLPNTITPPSCPTALKYQPQKRVGVLRYSVPDFQSGDMTPPQFLLHPAYPLHCDTHTFRESWYSRLSPASYPSQSCKLRSCLKCTHLQSNFNLIISA